MSKPTTHKVVSGDTLSALAKKYGTTVKELKNINGLKSDLIKVNQVLKLVQSPQPAREVVVQSASISSKTAKSRSLTAEEVALAKSVFGNAIRYGEVQIFKVDYAPLQDKNLVIAPNGNIYPGKDVYRDNYALASDKMKHLFIHEMGHVWQNHTGQWVKTRAVIAHTCGYLNDTNPYLYNIHQTFGTKTVKVVGFDGKTVSNVVPVVSELSDYNVESQAEIFADYWALKIMGNPSLMNPKNFKTNIGARRLDEVIRIYEKKIKAVIGR